MTAATTAHDRLRHAQQRAAVRTAIVLGVVALALFAFTLWRGW